MSDLQYKVVVGLEIHVQLCTKSKMFCSCAVEFGLPPNSRVCPVCIGMPGVLPVMNKKAYEFAVLTALALNCKIARFTKWDRKSYYYPDLPKNYQISQYDLPLGFEGFIEIPLESGSSKKIRIRRTHLEEDAGKNLHPSGNFSQVDLNRTGTALLEIVTEPDMNSAAEVKSLAVELQKIVRYLGVSEADMQKGHMRFEPNVNLTITRDGIEYKTPITEIKNLNSFRVVEKSIEYEIHRQIDAFLETGKVLTPGSKTTRGWDDAREETILQREKEEADDYRYFPDPDLLPVRIDDKWLAQIKENLCELPLQKQNRFIKEYGLTEYDAAVLTADRDNAEFFDKAVKAGADPKRVCNLLTQVGLKLANEKGVSLIQLDVKPETIAKLTKMVESGLVNASAANTILEQIVLTGKEPNQLAEELNLLQKSDEQELEKIIIEVLADNAKAVEEVKSGGKKSGKARGFLLGQVMQKTKGRANPQVVSKILDKKLANPDS
jgi:aspartyl-tRNA(Asn)/glutamyl-tRNA(Gln) amidotransferase subunit B